MAEGVAWDGMGVTIRPRRVARRVSWEPGDVDLVVPPGPGLPAGLMVPGELLRERFSRSRGPGGQGVNTTDSRVEVELSLADASWLTETQRSRAVAALGDVVTVAASEHRAQRRNRVAARERLAALLREALAPPPPARRATTPTRGSRERRIAAKRRRAQVKAQRTRPAPD